MARWRGAASPKISSGCAVPLTRLQSNLLRLLAGQRSPESYVAGAIAINRDGPRFSADIDIFHTALVTGLDEQTQLEWGADSNFRFFPGQPDPLFGYVLHPADLATNKAAADRRVPRDIVDLVTIHERILPLGAVVTAAVGRFPGMTPEEMLAEIRRHSTFTADEFETLATEQPLDIRALHKRIKAMLSQADAFVAQLPSDAVGCLFLEDGKPVQPDPTALARYVRHSGARRGHWPSSSQIATAMLEAYSQSPRTT
jgi:hypothetical protein